MTALKAVTSVTAWQYREEASKGSIEVGKLADLVILKQNPLTAAIDDIPHIAVVETFKEGQSIYRADEKHGELWLGSTPTQVGMQNRGFVADGGDEQRLGSRCCDGRLTGSVQAEALAGMEALVESRLFDA